MTTEQFRFDLETYQAALGQYSLRLKDELEYLENCWRLLNEVYEGDAAEDFAGAWIKTLAAFQDSVEKTRALINFLEETSHAQLSKLSSL